MLTVLETRYMEQVPRLLYELIDQLKELRKEVEELREELHLQENES